VGADDEDRLTRLETEVEQCCNRAAASAAGSSFGAEREGRSRLQTAFLETLADLPQADLIAREVVTSSRWKTARTRTTPTGSLGRP
jgi:hypothetical protein